MSETQAQLSSVATGLAEMIKRVSESAEQFRVSGREDLAGDLFEVERSLNTAARRLSGLVRNLG